MSRIIVLDISQTYTQIYDEIYYTERDKEKYEDTINSYAAQTDKYVCITITY